MNKKQEKIYNWLLKRPGYLKCSTERIAERANLPGTPEDYRSALKKAKNAFKEEIDEPELVEIKKEEPKLFKRLYFDIETSPNIVYTWNIGQKVFLDHNSIVKERAVICICYKWAHENEVHSISWRKGDDKFLLMEFIKVMNSADEVIGHNSDNYDIKWLKTRCLFHRIEAFPSYQSVDTLKLSRSGFRFNSNKLDYIGSFLGLGKKIDTGGFKLWRQIIEDNNPESMQSMITYCKQDVRLLENVHKTLVPYTAHKSHIGVAMGHSQCSCPECGSENVESNGYRYLASGGRKKRVRCKDCGKHWTLSERKSKLI